MIEKPTVYSVSEITAEIKSLIRSGFGPVTIKGEIKDFTHYRASGHMYFSLSDEESTLQCVMFKHSNRNLEFDPEEGMTVIASGRLDVYEERGNYQLIAEEMEESGLGELEKQFQELKEKLDREGAFDQSHKHPLPKFPSTIGIVTSGDGAAFWDIVQVIERRCPVIRIVLYPSRVNGRNAASDIVHGITRLPEITELDCMIVGRGGGSPEDLWGFNTEKVARAILECPVPVISAVGHEVDVTISDLVADHRSPTPSAAGEEVVPSIDELSERLGTQSQKIRTAFRSQLDRKWDRLRHIAEKPVFADLERLLDPFKKNLDREIERLRTHYCHFVDQQTHKLSQRKQRIMTLNPKKTLERGYAAIQKGEKILTSISDLELDDTVTIQWADGESDAKITEIRADNE